MALGPFTEKHSFSLCNTAPESLVGGHLLSKLEGLTHVSNGDLPLEFPDQPELYLLCSLPSLLDIEEEEFQQSSNLNEVPENLQAIIKTDI